MLRFAVVPLQDCVCVLRVTLRLSPCLSTVYASTASACLVRKPTGDGEYFEPVKKSPRESDFNEDYRRNKILGTLWDASPTVGPFGTLCGY